MKPKSKFFNSFLMFLLVLGILSFVSTLFFRDSLSDFTKGFLEGFAGTAILIGIVHIVVCRIQGRNPYTGEH